MLDCPSNLIVFYLESPSIGSNLLTPIVVDLLKLLVPCANVTISLELLDSSSSSKLSSSDDDGL